MLSKTATVAAMALAAAKFTSAQTFTDCDPTKEDCKPAPAFADDVNVDFREGNGEDYLYTFDGTTVKYDDNLGAIFSIANDKQAPTKGSHGYIFFGEVECEVQAAPGAGIVTSIVLEADDLDEIDWEWVGGDNEQVQTNYFSKGDTSTYDRGGFHPVTNPTGQFHKYGIKWTQEQIDWTIDGAVVRTLTYEEASGGATYPQSPMQVKMGTWVAGREGAGEGTIEWAGGMAEWDNAPFIGYYRQCHIVDYMGGHDSAVRYEYGDRSGTWESVIVVTEDDDDSTTTSTKSSTSTRASTSTSASASASASSSDAESSSSEASSASSAASSSATTLSTSAVSSPSGSASGSPSETGTPTATGSSDAVTDPSTVPSDDSAGVATRANLALGAAALFFAYMM